MIARLARAVSRLLGIPLGREGVHVRPAGVHVLLKVTEFRSLLTAERARDLAHALEMAADEVGREQRRRAAAAAGGAP